MEELNYENTDKKYERPEEVDATARTVVVTLEIEPTKRLVVVRVGQNTLVLTPGQARDLGGDYWGRRISWGREEDVVGEDDRGLFAEVAGEDLDRMQICKRCGCCSLYWEGCYNCGGEGFRELYEDDPLWYDEDDLETCDVCNGKGGFWLCIGHCDENGKHGAKTDS